MVVAIRGLYGAAELGAFAGYLPLLLVGLDMLSGDMNVKLFGDVVDLSEIGGALDVLFSCCGMPLSVAAKQEGLVTEFVFLIAYFAGTGGKCDFCGAEIFRSWALLIYLVHPFIWRVFIPSAASCILIASVFPYFYIWSTKHGFVCARSGRCGRKVDHEA